MRRYKSKNKRKSIILTGNVTIQNYVQKLRLHSTPEVKLNSSSIDLKMLRDGALLTQSGRLFHNLEMM